MISLKIYNENLHISHLLFTLYRDIGTGGFQFQTKKNTSSMSNETIQCNVAIVKLISV